MIADMVSDKKFHPELFIWGRILHILLVFILRIKFQM